MAQIKKLPNLNDQGPIGQLGKNFELIGHWKLGFGIYKIMILDLILKYPFLLAFMWGFIPAMFWLWFWLKEDTHPEPAKMVTLSFLGGVASVILVLPVQKMIFLYFSDNITLSFALYATVEEIFKFIFVYFIALRNKKVTEEPVDDIIYLIISALGFATFENTLFLIPGVASGDFLTVMVHGNLRFLGASLLHVMSSGAVGVSLALAFYKTPIKKVEHVICGIAIATVLHTAFNLFIINGADGNIFLVFGSVWIGIIALLLMFEKIKQLKNI